MVAGLVLLAGGMAPATLAAPGNESAAVVNQTQNVDWMSSGTAASLDIGMDVMVPTWIPAPFSGIAPSVTASGGYYQLYWMVSGGAPTFLYIEGTVGGGLPAGSPADLNKPLSINASVQGWSAIQDTGVPAGSDTPIYDQVWWVANGVLYTVSSNNMTGSDSLSLANSLIVLQPPYVAPDPPTEEPYVPPVATDPDPVDQAPMYEAPVQDSQPVQQEPASTNVTTEPRSVDTETVSEPRLVVGSGTSNTNTVQDGSQSASSSGSGAGPWSPSRFDPTTPSDGTSGAMPPVIGGDGTGGLYDTALPNIFLRP